ncbi:thiamine-phosphate kinase [Buchananella hordeovulneris]|uniref:thiamine-phosphate kinase n=1 Tax=Buchananella hordeovulneris TaxID=52770 RepID=UPI000F5F77F9|nr:thiamine-phosphate kinase [Buchananella hordeovulneris]RRD44112.1 thiamine-phosphate kinase [Buchananella hordeovulneris]
MRPAPEVFAPQVRVEQVDEGELIAAFTPLLPRGAHTQLGPGDDCAVVGTPGGNVVVTCDLLVEGRHFWLDVSNPCDIGRRAAAQNLADVAAMGATPTALVCALALPGQLPAQWVVELAYGLGQAAATAGAGVVGGDLTGGSQVAVSITAFGQLAGRAAVTRAGAQPGDVVALAGTVGMSAAGYEVARHLRARPTADAGQTGAGQRQAAPHLSRGDELPTAVAACLEIFRAPQPPLNVGPAAARAGATAMLDVSDGLLRDAGRLARASGVAVALTEATTWLPAVTATLQASAAWLGHGEETVRRWLLTGGEDHGLLACFPPGVALPAPFVPIGRVVDGPRGQVRAPGPQLASAGWDHFAPVP